MVEKYRQHPCFIDKYKKSVVMGNMVLSG